MSLSHKPGSVSVIVKKSPYGHHNRFILMRVTPIIKLIVTAYISHQLHGTGSYGVYIRSMVNIASSNDSSRKLVVNPNDGELCSNTWDLF